MSTHSEETEDSTDDSIHGRSQQRLLSRASSSAQLPRPGSHESQHRGSRPQSTERIRMVSSSIHGNSQDLRQTPSTTSSIHGNSQDLRQKPSTTSSIHGNSQDPRQKPSTTSSIHGNSQDLRQKPSTQASHSVQRLKSQTKIITDGAKQSVSESQAHGPSQTLLPEGSKLVRPPPKAPGINVPTLGPPLSKPPDDLTYTFTRRQQIENAVYITLMIVLLIALLLVIFTGATPLSKEAFYDKYHKKLDTHSGEPIKDQEKNAEMEEKTASHELAPNMDDAYIPRKRRTPAIPKVVIKSRHVIYKNKRVSTGKTLKCLTQGNRPLTSEDTTWLAASGEYTTSTPNAEKTGVYVCKDTDGDLHEQIVINYEQPTMKRVGVKEIPFESSKCPSEQIGMRIFNNAKRTLCSRFRNGCPFELKITQCVKQQNMEKNLVSVRFGIPKIKKPPPSCDADCVYKKRLRNVEAKQNNYYPKTVEIFLEAFSKFQSSPKLNNWHFENITNAIHCPKQGFVLRNHSMCTPCFPDSYHKHSPSDKTAATECTPCPDHKYQPTFGMDRCLTCPPRDKISFVDGAEKCYTTNTPSIESPRPITRRSLIDKEAPRDEEYDDDDLVDKKLPFTVPKNAIERIEEDVEKLEIKMEELPTNTRAILISVFSILLVIVVGLFIRIHWKRVIGFEAKTFPLRLKVTEYAAKQMVKGSQTRLSEMFEEPPETEIKVRSLLNEEDDVANLKDFDGEGGGGGNDKNVNMNAYLNFGSSSSVSSFPEGIVDEWKSTCYSESVTNSCSLHTALSPDSYVSSTGVSTLCQCTQCTKTAAQIFEGSSYGYQYGYSWEGWRDYEKSSSSSIRPAVAGSLWNRKLSKKSSNIRAPPKSGPSVHSKPRSYQVVTAMNSSNRHVQKVYAKNFVIK